MVLRFESLESRRLLAADIEVFHALTDEANVGEQVSRIIRVHSDADAAVDIQSSLTNELDDPTWLRFRTHGKDWTNLQDLEPSQRIRADFTPIGDFNGDGIDDLLAEISDNERIVVFAGPSTAAGISLAPAETGPRLSGTLVPTLKSIGDINGDGFDDLAANSLHSSSELNLDNQSVTIIFGLDSKDGNTVIELDGLTSSHSTVIQGVSEISLVGDVDGDGIDNVFLGNRNEGLVWRDNYVYEPAHILRGSEQLAPDREFSLEDLNDSGNLSEPLGRVRRASDAGDINGDGFDDAIIEFSDDNNGSEPAILYGNTSGDLATTTLGLEAPLHRHFAFEMAGDHDGDGFDDLLFSYFGGNCDCGASGRPNVTSTALVIYGGTGEGTLGDRTTSLNLDVVSPFDTFPSPGIAQFVNVDGDERADIAFRAEQRLIIVRGESNPTDIDFGHVWYGNTQFDGDRTYGFYDWDQRTLSEIRHYDINGDKITDFAAESRIYLGAERRPEAMGVGNLGNQTLIFANTSVTFEVNGRIKENAQPISTVALVVGGQDPDLTNNVVSNRRPVLLDVEVQQSRLQDEHSTVVQITNRGPHNATDVTLEETLTESLSNVTWERTMQATFPSVSLTGPDTSALSEVESTPTSAQFERYFGKPLYTELGTQIGSLGDINGDGIDDVVVSWVERIRFESHVRQLYLLGSTELAEDGINVRSDFEAVPNELGTREIAFGDLNNDGFLDAVHANFSGRDFGGVVFGGPGIDTTRIPTNLDGTLGFRIPFTGNDAVVLSGFDINADGIDDLLVGNGSAGETASAAASTRYGAVHLIFGRSTAPSTGTGNASQQFDVLAGETVTLTLRGTAPTTPGGQIQVTLAPAQFDLESNSTFTFTSTPEPIRGDFNDDGLVGFADFLILSANFGQSDKEPHEGDLNQDSIVSFADFLILAYIIGSQ